MVACLASRQHDLGALQRHARSLSPQRVVERGFAVVRRADGTVVRGPDQVAPGDIVEVTLARGVIAARVERSGGPYPESNR
jgi:exodeoxyribonuclease VII large subunit